MIRWALSNDGVAVAQWVSALLSLAAIVLALVLFGREQRRANGDTLREQQREIAALDRAGAEIVQRRLRLRLTAIDLVDQALTIMTENLPPEGAMYTSWSPDRDKPLSLRAINLTLETISAVSVGDIDILVPIAKARSIIDATVYPPGLGTSPPVAGLLGHLAREAEELKQVRLALIEPND